MATLLFLSSLDAIYQMMFDIRDLYWLRHESKEERKFWGQFHRHKEHNLHYEAYFQARIDIAREYDRREPIEDTFYTPRDVNFERSVASDQKRFYRLLKNMANLYYEHDY